MTVTLEQIYEHMPEAQLMGRGYLLAYCPFHDDSKKSLLVFKDWYRCLGCEANGPLHRLYAEILSPGSTRNHGADNFKGRAPRIPSDPEGMAEFVYSAHDAILRNASFRWYLEQRGVAGRIETCRLGWVEGWVTVPVFDEDNNLQGVILRAGPYAEKATGMRFSQVEGQRSMLYCPEWALLRNSDNVAAVFGIFDALTLAELRIPVVTVTGGDRTFTAEHLTNLRKRIIIIPDKKAGEAAAELSAGLGWRGKVKHLQYPNGTTDLNDYLTSGHSKDLLRELGADFGG